MAVNLVHSFVTTKANSPDPSLVSATAWNAQHSLTAQPLSVLVAPAGTPSPQNVVDLPATADGQVLTRAAGALVWATVAAALAAAAHGVLIGEGAAPIISLISSAAGQVLQGNGGAADPTWTGSPLFASGTITTSQPVQLTQTWNAGGVTFNALLVNATSTASAAASTLMDLQVGGVSCFNVNKTGTLTIVPQVFPFTLLQVDAARTIYSSGGGAFCFGNNASTSGFVMDMSNGNFFLNNYIGFQSSFNSVGSNADLFLRRAGAASLQLGDAAAASPVAQTLGVQSVVAGTSNTAGVDWTFNASAGTGTGAGGNILFKLAPAGGSGTSQNARSSTITFAPGTAFLASTPAIYAPGSDLLIGAINQFVYFGATSSGNSHAFLNNTEMRMRSGLQIGWSSNALDPSQAAADTILTRKAAATLQHGAADAAAPVAQTLSVQSVLAGTSNTAGANWTFKASAGTGTGAGGNFSFQIAPAGGSGTSQNTFIELLGLTSGNIVNLFNASARAAYASGLILTSASNSWYFPSTGLSMPGGGAFGFSSNATDGSAAAADTLLIRKAAANWQFGNTDAAAPVAQTLSVQSVIAGTSNTAGVDWTFNASRGTGTGQGGRFIFQLAPAGGAGSSQNALAQAMIIAPGNPNTVTFAANTVLTTFATNDLNIQPTGSLDLGSNNAFQWQIDSAAGRFKAVSDNTNDIGASNVNRPRHAFLGGALATAVPNTQSGTTYSMSATDSSIIFSNAAAVTLTLQAASSYFGRWLYVKNIGAGTLVSASSNVVPIGSSTAGTAILAAGPGKWAILESDGTNWIIMAAN